MRRFLAAVLMMLLCLLCACGGKETDNLQQPMDFRTQLQQAGGCGFTAEVTADVDERVYTFTLRCDCKTDGTGTVSVTAPDTIEGISAELTESGGLLRFDGMALDFGTAEDISPVAAPLLVCGCWAGEYIANVGQEDENLRVSYEKGYDTDMVTVNTWFEPEKNFPIFAEICYNSRAAIKMTVTDFSFSGGGEHETTQENVGGCVTGQSEP